MEQNQGQGKGGAMPDPQRKPYGRRFLREYDPAALPGRADRWHLLEDGTPQHEGGFMPGMTFPANEFLGMLQVGSLANGTKARNKEHTYTVEKTFSLRRDDGQLYKTTGWPPRLERVRARR